MYKVLRGFRSEAVLIKVLGNRQVAHRDVTVMNSGWLGSVLFSREVTGSACLCSIDSPWAFWGMAMLEKWCFRTCEASLEAFKVQGAWQSCTVTSLAFDFWESFEKGRMGKKQNWYCCPKRGWKGAITQNRTRPWSHCCHRQKSLLCSKKPNSSLPQLFLLPHTYTQDKLVFTTAALGHSVPCVTSYSCGTSLFLLLGCDRHNPATGRMQQVINHTVYKSSPHSFHSLFALVLTVHSLSATLARTQNTRCILKGVSGDEKWAVWRGELIHHVWTGPFCFVCFAIC